MANRYWVGGDGTWDTTTHWSATSGGAGGASVPKASDSVFFDQAGTYTVSISYTATCLDFTVSAGTVSFSGSSYNLNVYGSLSISAATSFFSFGGGIVFKATSTGKTITTNGVLLYTSLTFDGVGGGWTLGSELSFSGGKNITVTNGSFSTGNYSISGMSTLKSSNSNTRSISLGSSTIALSFIDFTTDTNLTFNAGTSTLNCPSLTIQAANKTFYNVAVTNSANFGIGSNTFNNLTFAGSTSAASQQLVTFNYSQTINGTLTRSSGTNSACRAFFKSQTVGSPITLTCAAVSLTDVDFMDITFAGASIPVSGIRLGDCNGNSNITFPASKTVYWNQLAGGNIYDAAWATTSGGSPSANNFPLAQDTAIFDNAGLNSGATITVGGTFNLGSIDMSLRTSNTMTLGFSYDTLSIFGNWTNGTGTTISSTSGTVVFLNRSAKTLTSAGKLFPTIQIKCLGSSLTLQDNFNGTQIYFNYGEFNINSNSVVLSSSFSVNGLSAKTLAIGTGSISIGASGSMAWYVGPGTPLSITGSGTINLTSASAKTFVGGDVITYPTINQGGAGTLTITGSNKFNNITNTVQPTSILFTAGTTNTFNNFSLSGTSGNIVTIGSVTAASHTLSKDSGIVSVQYCSISYSTATGGATWKAPTNLGNTNGGNNTGWDFTSTASGNGLFFGSNF